MIIICDNPSHVFFLFRSLCLFYYCESDMNFAIITLCLDLLFIGPSMFSEKLNKATNCKRWIRKWSKYPERWFWPCRCNTSKPPFYKRLCVDFAQVHVFRCLVCESYYTYKIGKPHLWESSSLESMFWDFTFLFSFIRDLMVIAVTQFCAYRQFDLKIVIYF